MTIILIVYCLVVLFGLRLNKNKSEYMSKKTTCNIKGIFTIMILLSHFKGYISISETSLYCKILSLIGQLMVTMFFFYSGYGIMESIKNKKNYMKGFLKNRFLKTLLHFDLAIFIYIVISTILGNHYDSLTYVLAFTGWTSVGNSNWFVFVMLALYLLTFISYIIFKNERKFLISTFISSGLLIVALYLCKEYWWYNIILCYPAGMLFSFCKNKIESFVKKPWISLMILSFTFILLYIFKSKLIVYELLSCIFSLLIVNITYIFCIENKVLNFFGTYAFEIYILQRIPYMALSGLIKNDILYFITSLAIIVIISIIFKWITGKIDKKFFARNER